MHRTTIAGLMLLAAITAVTMAEPPTAEPNARISACRPDNDLFQLLKAASASCRGLDTPAEALQAAPRRDAALLPADGYPAEQPPLTEADFDLAMEMETSRGGLSAESPIAKHCERSRKTMPPDDENLSEKPPRYTIEGELDLTAAEETVNLGDLNLRAPATIAVWVKGTTLDGDQRFLSHLTGKEDQPGSLRFDKRQLQVFDGKTNWKVLIGDGLEPDRWLHIAAVFQDDGTVTGYLDGRPQQTALSGFAFDGVGAAIGARWLGLWGNRYQGSIRDLRIFRTALSNDEVAACIDEFRPQHSVAGETEAGPIVLENSRLAVAIDRRSGAIRSIRDKVQDMTYSLSGIGFSVATDGGALHADTATSVRADGASAQFSFSGNGLDVTLHYRLGDGEPFIEKWLGIEAKDGKPYFLNEVCLEDVDLGPQFCEIHFHDDQTKWHCPINFFLRGEQGGCYAGLQYPYWEKDVRGHRGYRLGYAPNYPVTAGETFTSEKYFLGVYRYEGIYRYAHGPFPGPSGPAYLTFNNASVSHYSDTRDVAPEVLDWGEVWAMQRYMRHVLPPHKMPEDGYWAWVNAWWHWAYTWKHITKEDLDVMRESGIHDVMTQEMWFGHSQHPLMADYVADFDPAEPPDFRAAKHIEELHAYGKQIGVYVASFSSPPISFTRRPEWLSLNRDGAPITYIQGVKANCPASDDYMNYLVSLYLHIFDRYQPRFWGFDGRWTSFREVPYGDGRGIEPDPCFAANHGHPPGDNRYREYRNTMRLLAELRRKHPRMCLETYYGLKRVYPWAARELNATENYYESNGSDIDRFQQWHNQNGRFLPPDRNYAAVFGRTPEAFRHSFIACLASAPYCQVGAGLQHLSDPETRDFFKKWRDWGGRHHDYLQVKRDMFPTFGYAPLDGSAHILKDRGFLFLFPTGLQPNTHTPANDEGIEARVRQWPNVLRAAIRLNHWIGLEQNPDLLLKVVEVYPRENRVLGTYRYGQEFIYDQPTNSAAILSLTPVAAIEPATDQPFDATAPAERVRVVSAFEEDVMTTAQFLSKSKAERADVFFTSNRLETASGRWNLVDGVALEHFEAGDMNQFASQAVDLQDLRLNPPATVATWIRVAETPKDLRVFSQRSGSTDQAGAIRLDGAQVQVWNGNAWQSVISDGVLPGRWLHIAVTFHADGRAVGYLNGGEQNSAPSGLDFLGTPAGVGAKFLGEHGNEFVGKMRDFQIHRRILSAGELARLAGESPQ